MTNRLINFTKKLSGLFVLGMALVLGTQMAHAQDLPTNPQPGKCYVKCVTPDEFETTEERVMVSPGYSRLEIVPAVYETVEERVLVKEGTKKFIYHPAEYETVEVPYVSKQGRNDLRVIPAKLTSSSERMQVYPPVARWEYTSYADCQSPNPDDCQVICWKEYPARYQTVPTEVLANNATTESVSVDERNSTYTKRVIKKEAYVEEITIEPEYRTITKEVLKTPATTRKVNIDPVYKTVTKTMLKKKGGITVWEEIDCKLTQAVILPIYWDFNSARVSNESKNTVNETLLALLNDKPNISIELSSHTDSRGSDSYNMSLSQRRADAIKNYLVSRGINSNRIVSKGYGESRLKNRCKNGVECSESEHQMNRRTEYRVIGATN